MDWTETELGNIVGVLFSRAVNTFITNSGQINTTTNDNLVITNLIIRGTGSGQVGNYLMLVSVYQQW